MPSFLAGITVGVIILQTMVFAPTLFRTLEMPHAGKLLRALFPKFFLLVAFLGLATLLSTFLSRDGSTAQAILAGITVLLPLICRVLVPITNRATDAGDTARFKQLHTLSVVLTLVVLGSNIAIPLLPAAG